MDFTNPYLAFLVILILIKLRHRLNLHPQQHRLPAIIRGLMPQASTHLILKRAGYFLAGIPVAFARSPS